MPFQPPAQGILVVGSRRVVEYFQFPGSIIVLDIGELDDAVVVNTVIGTVASGKLSVVLLQPAQEITEVLVLVTSVAVGTCRYRCRGDQSRLCIARDEELSAYSVVVATEVQAIAVVSCSPFSKPHFL